MTWDTACVDWQERILACRSLVPELPLFKAEADKAARIYSRLRLPDVIGNPTLGDVGGPWFLDIVRAMFGSYDRAAGIRHLQELFLLVAKKNSKSTGAAGVMLTAAIMNDRPLAELLFIAPTKEIADIAFGQASGMVAADPKLETLFHLQRHIRTLTHRVTEAKLQIKAADTDAITGSKATYTLVDETHEFASKSRAAEVFVELRGALAARKDGFLAQITTQSKSPPAGVFKAELDKARAVRDGRRKLPMLAVLYEFPDQFIKDGTWRDPKNFRLTNPNLGRSVNEEFLLRELETAEGAGIDALALFASQHLNVEIGLGLKTDRWAGADHWLANATTVTLDEVLERAEVVTVGIDGGGLDDLLGLAVLGREVETRQWLLWTHAWAHPSALERRKSEMPKYRDFEKDGDLTVVKEIGDDVSDVADIVEQVERSGRLDRVGVDPVGIGAVVDAVMERGIEFERIVGIPQGWKLTGAIKTAERRLAEKALKHGGQRLMAWCVGNAKVEPRGNAIIITKQLAGAGKIDPLMATFNAVALMAMNPEARSSIVSSLGVVTA